jgi:RND family efflux transporter MFP subunit
LSVATAAAVSSLLVLIASSAAAGDFECLIRPKATISLGIPAEGIIAQVHVDRGDRVEAGQVLVELESKVEEARLAIARARAAGKADFLSSEARARFADRAVDRQEELSLKSIISQVDLDEARSSKELADAGLVEAREARHLAVLEVTRTQAELERRVARSPVAGVVAERLMAPGEYVDAQPVLKLAQVDPLNVEVFAPISMLGRVQVGSKARVKPEAPAGGVRLATVTAVDAVVDAASGTFGVRLEIPNPEYAVIAGLRCRVEFDEPTAAESAAR